VLARVQRVLLVLLAASAAFVGFWAVAAPRSFYDTFPAFGRHWVDVDGPYNEHLVRDVGGLYLALLVVSIGALWIAESRVVQFAGGAWLIFSVPHFIYHAANLGPLSDVDAVLEMLSLGLTLIGAAALLLPVSWRSSPGSDTMRLPRSKR
jgi:hypothetical protein